LEYRFPDAGLAVEAMNYVTDVKQRYQPGRQFKQREGAHFDTLKERAEATLLEYGEKVYGAVVFDKERQDRKRERDQQRGGKGPGLVKEGVAELSAEERQELQQAQREETTRLETLMEQQLSAEGAEVQVGKAGVGSIISMQAGNIRRAVEEYALAAADQGS
jgi:hypothetical protein